MVRRSAFTLIELIFAIVIIAISVISLPMMTQTVSKGIDANIVQEAIFAAATELNEAVSSHWDDKSIELDMLDSSARVVETAAMCDNTATNSTYRQMPGHINQPLHRRCLDSNAVLAAPSASTNSDVDSLEDRAHSAANIFINSNPNQAGYKETYQSALTITHPANFNGSNNNIKMITSTITDSGSNTIALLRTYSANIGEVDYYKRSY